MATPSPSLNPTDSTTLGIAQRLTAVEVELKNLKEENATQHAEVGKKLDELVDSLTKGPESHEARLRVLEALGNKGLAIVGVAGIVLGALLGMLFGWIPNPFSHSGK